MLNVEMYAFVNSVNTDQTVPAKVVLSGIVVFVSVEFWLF